MIALVVFLGNCGKEYEKTRHNAAWLFEQSLPFSSKINWKNKFKGNFASIDTLSLKSWIQDSNIIAGTRPAAKNAGSGTASAPATPAVVNSVGMRPAAAQESFSAGSAGSKSQVLNLPSSIGDKFYFLKPETYMNLSGQSVAEAAHFLKISPEQVLIVHDEIELPLGFVSLKWSGGLGGHNGLRSIKTELGTADFWRLRIGISKPSYGSVADYVLGRFTSDEQILLSQIFLQTAELFAKTLFSSDPKRLIPEWGKRKLADAAGACVQDAH
ncbi:peptidyl-tRNA hydrolase [Treponema parvum]|uniref:Peptidyl-tRNA hydrolase n=1 Tax=Treponema parvum TaxID=138851 RepID=A0A975F0W1_9SPIR|nr:aminoacyl-tRNA hydrolase [Treponema parvum]QTQ12392.1 peptidyl-tRNA hydrolase [Treponema parvum]